MNKSNIAHIRPHKAPNVLNENNTATVTLTDPRPNSWDSVELGVTADLPAIAQAVLDYSVRRCMPPSMIELAIIWPGDQALDFPGDLIFLKKQAD